MHKLAWILVVVTACGGDDGDEEVAPEEIDCTWFEGDNCYSDAVAAVEACLGYTTGDSGTFDATRDSCSYASGQEITFSTPIELPLPDGAPSYDFEVHNGDTFCASYETTDSRTTYGTPDGEVVIDYAAAMTLTCPDGSRYRISGDALRDCDYSKVPSIGTSDTESSLTFYFGVVDEFVEIFTCDDP